MSNLAWQLRELQKHNRDGSFSTQNSRREALSLIAKQLKEMGYNQFSIKSFKQKHAIKLVDRWKAEELSAGTIKNRMTHIRWWNGKVNRVHLIPSNDDLGIDHRVHVTNISKAVELTNTHLQNIKNENIRDSVKLQSLFGLRREESMKFNPQYADQGSHIKLKGSWCKGSRSREVVISTSEQREFLDYLNIKYGDASLIPPNLRYIDQLNIYKNEVPESGLGKGHGLRHRYAQIRYKLLSGNECPANGGIHQKEMTPEQREKDRDIRLQISAELGHSREQITSVYLGS